MSILIEEIGITYNMFIVLLAISILLQTIVLIGVNNDMVEGHVPMAINIVSIVLLCFIRQLAPIALGVTVTNVIFLAGLLCCAAID